MDFDEHCYLYYTGVDEMMVLMTLVILQRINVMRL